ncbi:MAG TPA: 30S ribosomal protein S12 methylthiotransferase RimO [Anaerolineaceae bacterium]|nr:30S ribosomal protein S12 methylthiotransferase RimO [Anaerolineaceae bacterium]
MKDNTFYLTSLGCAKNTVDADSMAALLIRDGLIPVEKPSIARYLIVNTCGFIAQAREESISELKSMAQTKRDGQFLLAAGCLTQRYGNQILDEVQGIDGILGTRNWASILPVIANMRSEKPAIPYMDVFNDAPVLMDYLHISRVSLQGSSAYLKIADGCRRNCAFCAIPSIKGKNVSRTTDAILSDARLLQSQGIKEINLISQDTTDYASDFGVKDGLANLIDELCTAIPDVPWIRLLYAFPGFVSDRLIEKMASRPQILHYLDIPLQHADPNILRSMYRPSNVDWTIKTIEKMRNAMPDLAIRTTFIVGYPGEGEKEFQTLLDFVSEIRFDKVGVFPYSFEKGTPAEHLGDPVSVEEKEARVERLMLLQQDISLKQNLKLIGKTIPVLIEGKDENILIGRSYRDAPEIDGLVFVDGNANPGDLVNARVTDAMVYDLIGKII